MPGVLKGGGAQDLPRVEWRPWGGGGPAGASQPRPAGAGPTAPPAIDSVLAEKQAFERGLREGEATGARKGLEQVQAAVQGFAQNAAQLASYKPQLRAEVEQQLVTLSMAVAQKILKRELSIDPNIVLAVVKGCLQELENVEIYRIRVHPQDAPALTAYLQQHQRKNVEILPDAQVTRGGALLETAQGQLDARLETQLMEITHGLADR